MLNLLSYVSSQISWYRLEKSEKIKNNKEWKNAILELPFFTGTDINIRDSHPPHVSA
jgi:hypothetical protein